MNDSRKVSIFIALYIAGVFISIWAVSQYSINDTRIDKALSIVQNMSIKNYNEDSLRIELGILKFKEEGFTDQLSTQSSWIIAYTTLLFGIFGFIGYSVFDNQFKQMKEENERHKDFYDTKLAQLQIDFDRTKEALQEETDTLKEEYNDLKIKNLQTSHSSSVHWSDTFYHKKNYASAYAYGIRGVSELAEAYSYSKREKEKEDMVNSILHNLGVTKRRMELSLKEAKPSFTVDLRYDEITAYLLKILQIPDDQVVNLATRVIYLMEIAKMKKNEITAQ